MGVATGVVLRVKVVEAEVRTEESAVEVVTRRREAVAAVWTMEEEA